jgi:hypothetical protein
VFVGLGMWYHNECGPVGEAGLVYRGMIGSCGCGPASEVLWVWSSG